MRGFVILDFGSQVTQLIGRTLRDMGYYSEILPWDASLERINEKKPYGLILSGGPQSVYDKDAYVRDLGEIAQFPMLGICYGLQLMAHHWGGTVVPASNREYGNMSIKWNWKHDFFPNKVWMSHGDHVEKLPSGWEKLAISSSGSVAAAMSENGKHWGVQFHPEVSHTVDGFKIFDYFCKTTCGGKREWNTGAMVEQAKQYIKETVGDGKVLCALSGGVDSTVTAKLLTDTLGTERVQCVFVDTGLLRKNEGDEVMADYKTMGLNVLKLQAGSFFLNGLKGLTEPEKKRKSIGGNFISCFKNDISIKEAQFLAQGTLYPDVVESVAPRGSSHTIKTHHNVGGLPKELGFKLVEPLRWLFKDEVRKMGVSIGVPEHFVNKHPFPGPGLAVRIIGEVTEEKADLLREVDHVFISYLKEKGLYNKIWQAFAVLLPVKTVGVMGDGRTYEHAVTLRAITSRDGMTADWYRFSGDELAEVSNRITNQVKGVNRVTYDITSKPPGTIEWE
jgi:GMP synthase (glutamine-hydrolysing)